MILTFRQSNWTLSFSIIYSQPIPTILLFTVLSQFILHLFYTILKTIIHFIPFFIKQNFIIFMGKAFILLDQRCLKYFHSIIHSYSLMKANLS